VHGFWKIQLGNVYYYIREARNPETLARWAKDIREDWWDRRLFSKGTLGGICGLVLAMTVLGPAWVLFVVAVHLLLSVFLLAPCTCSCMSSCWPRPSTASTTGWGERTSATTPTRTTECSPG